MKKVTVTSLQANWECIGNRKPWEYVTSAELAKILGVHLQTINNWKLREVLPKPAANNPRLRGNKNYYGVDTIKAWLAGQTMEEFYTQWLVTADFD